jgi:cytochrome c oxidase subunit 1
MNQLASAGGAVLGLGVLVFVVNVLWTIRRGERAGDDPWAAETHEWATNSPPPPYGFLYPPVVVGREGRWAPGAGQLFVTGLDPDERQVLVGNLLDGEPELREVLPGPSIFPLLTALTVGATYVAVMFTPWGLVWGAVPVFLTLLGWTRHEGGTKDPGDEEDGDREAERRPNPAGATVEPVR